MSLKPRALFICFATIFLYKWGSGVGVVIFLDCAVCVKKLLYINDTQPPRNTLIRLFYSCVMFCPVMRCGRFRPFRTGLETKNSDPSGMDWPWIRMLWPVWLQGWHANTFSHILKAASLRKLIKFAAIFLYKWYRGLGSLFFRFLPFVLNKCSI